MQSGIGMDTHDLEQFLRQRQVCHRPLAARVRRRLVGCEDVHHVLTLPLELRTVIPAAPSTARAGYRRIQQLSPDRDSAFAVFDGARPGLIVVGQPFERHHAGIQRRGPGCEGTWREIPLCKQGGGVQPFEDDPAELAGNVLDN